MYENITYEDILRRILNRIPNTVDKREGSIIYDAIAPVALELQLMYIELDTVLKESFADTASREYLIRRAKERAITPEAATKAILKGVFTPSTVDVLGKRFNCGKLNYVAIEKITDGEYRMECETLGLDGNANFGQMIPIDYVNGLETAELTEILIPAQNEEDTEAFRARYFNSFESQAFGGNVADYKKKTNSITGVGNTMVTPVWNGGGTVLLTIVDSSFNRATEELIQLVQNTIDPTQDASGKGVAPIGHIVTVNTPSVEVVDIRTTLTFDDGYSFEQLKSKIIEVIEAYLSELRRTWGEGEPIIIRSSHLDARLLDIVGIVDIQNTMVNGVKNCTIPVTSIPVFESVANI